MRQFRKKQKRLFKLMNAIIIFSAIFIFLYIGAYPYILEWSKSAVTVCSYSCDLLIILVLCLVFSYYNKYSKSDKFLETIEYEIDDYGYYFSNRKEDNEKDYIYSLENCLKTNGFSINSNVEIEDFDFSLTATRKNEMFYIVNISDLSKDDLLAYIDVVINDITIYKLKRKGNVVICFLTDKAQDSAIEISKMITPLGKKEQIKIALAIIEPKENKCYFLGNMQTKCQQMISNYILNCEIPIPDNLKGEKNMQFQQKLEKHMQDFDIKKFKNGTFFAH